VRFCERQVKAFTEDAQGTGLPSQNPVLKECMNRAADWYPNIRQGQVSTTSKTSQENIL
jgi:hypothetical protein